MQHRSDGHSCRIWTVWMADEWIQYVQAGLPDPGFEGWLGHKLSQPFPPRPSHRLTHDMLPTIIWTARGRNPAHKLLLYQDDLSPHLLSVLN